MKGSGLSWFRSEAKAKTLYVAIQGDSSVAEFTLSEAEVLPRNDIAGQLWVLDHEGFPLMLKASLGSANAFRSVPTAAGGEVAVAN